MTKCISTFTVYLWTRKTCHLDTKGRL